MKTINEKVFEAKTELEVTLNQLELLDTSKEKLKDCKRSMKIVVRDLTNILKNLDSVSGRIG